MTVIVAGLDEIGSYPTVKTSHMYSPLSEAFVGLISKVPLFFKILNL